MSYGIDLPALYHGAGAYVRRIPNGEDPAELPVVEPTAFELVINLATAEALGISVPLNLIVTATEIIE
ncbi:MAG: ABC transporter substrate binding protein [Bauldia sp.]